MIGDQLSFLKTKRLIAAFRKTYAEYLAVRPARQHIFKTRAVNELAGVTQIKDPHNSALTLTWRQVDNSRAPVTNQVVGSEAERLDNQEFTVRAQDFFQMHGKLSFNPEELRGFVTVDGLEDPYRMNQWIKDQYGNSLERYSITEEDNSWRALLAGSIPYGVANIGFNGPKGTYSMNLASVISNQGNHWEDEDTDILGAEADYLKEQYLTKAGVPLAYVVIGSKIKRAILNNKKVLAGFIGGNGETLARQFLEQERAAADLGDPFANAVRLAGLMWVNIDPLGTVAGGTLTKYFSHGGSSEDVCLLLPAKSVMERNFHYVSAECPIPRDDGKGIEWATPGLVSWTYVNLETVEQLMHIRQISMPLIKDPSLVQRYKTFA